MIMKKIELQLVMSNLMMIGNPIFSFGRFDHIIGFTTSVLGLKAHTLSKESLTKRIEQ
jgi:hypothetical protein